MENPATADSAGSADVDAELGDLESLGHTDRLARKDVAPLEGSPTHTGSGVDVRAIMAKMGTAPVS